MTTVVNHRGLSRVNAYPLNDEQEDNSQQQLPQHQVPEAELGRRGNGGMIPIDDDFFSDNMVVETVGSNDDLLPPPNVVRKVRTPLSPPAATTGETSSLRSNPLSTAGRSSNGSSSKGQAVPPSYGKSIDYMPARDHSSCGASSSDGENFRDEDDDPASEDDDDETLASDSVFFNLRSPGYSIKFWVIFAAALSLLAALSIGWTMLTRSQKPQETLPVDNGYGLCADPIMSLQSSSSIQGIEQGSVASDHAVCSEMGMNILKEQGGNAVDAAVTTALCLGVANPSSSGLGGGAFILVHSSAENVVDDGLSLPDFVDARKRTNKSSPISVSGKITEVIDCRETAPEAATEDMYLNSLNPHASTIGGLAVAIPGELRGLELAHARHGKLPWSTCVEPVMRLAMHGVEVNAHLANTIEKMKPAFENGTDYGLRNMLTRGDSWSKPLREGELLQNQKLGELLEKVMDKGANAFYLGEQAQTLADEIQAAGGIITKEDIQFYSPTLRDPVWAHDVNGHSIVGVPPPSSGGAVVIGAARFVTGYSNPLASFADALSQHRISEALKHAFAIRMSLSDPDYNTSTVEAAVDDLTRGSYMEDLRALTKDNDTLPLSQYGGDKWAQLNDDDGSPDAADAQEGDRRRYRYLLRREVERSLYREFGYLEDSGTSHFSVVDKDGNAVAMTTSINTEFGSQVVSKSTGIVLGNTMDDFATPGEPDHFGLHPSEANYIRPGKKPLSSMSPTMVFRRTDEDPPNVLGGLALILGASGGPKIISAVLHSLLNNIMLGMPIFEALVEPRIHDQLIYHGSAVTTVEDTTLLHGQSIKVSQRTRDALERRNHGLLDVDYMGCVQAIAVDMETGHLASASDVRKGGAPAGY